MQHQKIDNVAERTHKKNRYEDALVQYANIEFGKVYTIKPKVLGTGSFGIAMLCDVKNSQDMCVVKIVNLKTSKHKNPDKILEREVKVYRDLCQHEKLKPYMVKMYQLTKFENHQGELCHALVMEYAGKDLDKILEAKGEYAFSRSQLLKIGLELVPALQTLHACHIVHRDLKPENLVLRLSKRRNIFQVRLIDYGLACNWDPNNEPRRKSRGAGTPRFCAWRQHFGYAGSPGRDMESLIYTLVYLSGKKLPWHGLKISDLRRKTRTIAYTKRDADARMLCACLDQDQGVTTTLAELLDETRVLKYSKMPDYKKFHLYFKQSLDRLHHLHQEFDSTSSTSSSSSSSSSCPNQTIQTTQPTQPMKRKSSSSPHPPSQTSRTSRLKKTSGS
jgi:serine/threonine protein kinase